MTLILNYLLFYSSLDVLKIFFSTIILLAFVTLIPFAATTLVIKGVETKDKSSAYECGFDPFESARTKFDVKFYLVSILFIIFDLEVVYLFPWVLIYNVLNPIVLLFLLILIIGLLYEYRSGALDWN